MTTKGMKQTPEWIAKRVASIRGRKLSPARKEILSKAHQHCECHGGIIKSASGHRLDEDVRAVISAKVKRLWQNPGYHAHMVLTHKGQVPWAAGLTKETNVALASISAKAKKRWRIAPEKFKVPIPSSIELLAQESLVGRGIQFFTSKYVECCIPDLVLADAKVVVFCDGDYYHGCPIHEPGDYMLHSRQPIKHVRQKDRRQRETLRSEGWSVIEAWGCEFVINPDIIGLKIDKLMKEGLEVKHTESQC